MAQVAVRNRSKALDALFHSATLFVLLLLVAVQAFAGSATLVWDPVASPALTGYVVYYGATAGNYTSKIDVGNTTMRMVSNLTEGATYHFAVTAYDSSHTESVFSNDASTTIPYGAPVAGFTASTTSGVAPLALNFTNTSTGSISTYAWTFGDGTSSTAQSPSHVYAAAGVFTVSLTATGSGGSNTKTMPNYVTVTAASTSDTSAPTAPSPLVASANGSSGISLNWNAASDNVGVTGYKIERCQGAGCTTFAQIATSRQSALGGGMGQRRRNDATSGVFPDWVQINFNGLKTIDRAVVYPVQDNYLAPVEPTDTLTFSLRGITDFQVQGYDGTNWITLATVAGNNLVKRSVTFTPYTTDRIRINVTHALAAWTRITEVEAWGQ